MADITMCTGVKSYGIKGTVICPMRDRCYRYTDPKGFMQSYFLSAPFEIGEMITCEMYLRESLWNDLKNAML